MTSYSRIPLLRWIGWFFCGNALQFCLLSIFYLSAITESNINLITPLNTFLAWFFLIVTWLGHCSLLAFLPAFISIILVLIIPYPPLIFFCSILFASLSVLLLSTDIIVYAQYHFHLNAIILHFVFSQERSQIFDFTWLEKTIFIAICLFIIMVESLFAKWLWKFLNKNPQSLHGKFIAVIITACLFLSYDMILLSSAQPVTIIYQQPQVFPLYNTIVSTLFSNFMPLSNLNKLGADMIRQPNPLTIKKMHYPLHALNCETPKQPLNIVIIAIDTWRFNMLNQQVSPHIADFAKSCWQFTNHYSGGNTTQPGIFSLFYSLPATYWPAALQNQQAPVLTQLLLQEHYQMGIYTSAALTLPAFNKTVFAHVPDLQLITQGKMPADRDQKITEEFAQFIQQAKINKKPFFSFLFYDTAHSFCTPFPHQQQFHPIIRTCNRFDLFPGNAAPLYINRYKSAVYYVDGLVDQDIKLLAQEHLLDNTVIIITADHGNEFNDNHQGYWGHGSNFTAYQTHVPLLIYWPGKTPHLFQQQTTHYDIAPTLVKNIFGCTNNLADYSVGRILPAQNDPLSFFIAASYIDFSVLEPNRITTIYYSGNIDITDLHNQEIPDATPDMKIMQQALHQMREFY